MIDFIIIKILITLISSSIILLLSHTPLSYIVVPKKELVNINFSVYNSAIFISSNSKVILENVNIEVLRDKTQNSSANGSRKSSKYSNIFSVSYNVLYNIRIEI